MFAREDNSKECMNKPTPHCGFSMTTSPFALAGLPGTIEEINYGRPGEFKYLAHSEITPELRKPGQTD